MCMYSTDDVILNNENTNVPESKLWGEVFKKNEFNKDRDKTEFLRLSFKVKV